MTVLKACSITKTYNDSFFNQVHREKEFQVLKGIDLEVFEGDCIGIMGRSGCGKTTLLKILGTIELPTEGEVLFHDISVKNYNDEKLSELRRTGIGFVFQDFNLFENLTVEENIMVPMVLSKFKKKEIDRSIRQCAELLELQPIMKKHSYEISGGEKQRVAIARAMINNPEIILVDEPTGNLDSASAKNVMEHLLMIHKKMKKTVIIVTHDPQIAEYCDQIIFLKDGVIIEKLDNRLKDNISFQNILDMMLRL